MHLHAPAHVTLPAASLHRSDWDLVHAIDRDGHTALHAAAAQGNVDTAEALLSRGSNPSVQDYEGYTPLHWAVESNAPEIVALLLKHSADSTVKNNSGFTAYDMVRGRRARRLLPCDCAGPGCHERRLLAICESVVAIPRCHSTPLPPPQIHLLKSKHQTPMFMLLSDPRRASVAGGASSSLGGVSGAGAGAGAGAGKAAAPAAVSGVPAAAAAPAAGAKAAAAPAAAVAGAPAPAAAAAGASGARPGVAIPRI